MERKQQDCRCGIDKEENLYILDDYKYSFWGWVLLSIGISAIPTRLIRKCSKCNEQIEDIQDPQKLREHIGR